MIPTSLANRCFHPSPDVFLVVESSGQVFIVRQTYENVESSSFGQHCSPRNRKISTSIALHVMLFKSTTDLKAKF